MQPVTAIIVTFNSAHIIAPCLMALQAHPQIEAVIVVDNASSDGTAERIARDFPQVELIRNERNLGFGAANNRALERMQTPFALLINPDALLRPGALEKLLDAAARYPDAGLLAPQLFHEDGSVQINYKPSLFVREKQKSTSLPPAGDICAGFLSGAVWFARMAALRQSGFFDPALFFYYEDDDLCLRLRRAGYALVLIADAHATHIMGKSSAPSPQARSFRLYHDTWSRLYMEFKYRDHHAARRMGTRRRRHYRLLLWLARITGIRSLSERYGPRHQAVRDFMSFLSEQGR